MIVVPDTTPLNYLVLIGQADLLWQLYQRVIIPPAVYAELQRANTPEPVKAMPCSLKAARKSRAKVNWS
jgi:predicted nucleic acid-binding protein